MSLSKYYKDSSSFKREEIVKSHSPEEVQGWNPANKTTSTPFEPNSPPPSSDKGVQPELRQKAATGADDPASAPAPGTAGQPPDIPQPDTAIDLSSYVLLEEAEKKAADMYQQGLQEGLAKAAEDFGSSVRALTTSCELLDSIRETIINNSSSEFLDFTLLLAEKIIRLSIKNQDQTIVATIEEALSRAVKSDVFTIFIHPDDHQIISDKAAELIAGISGLNDIVLKTDPTIEKGGAKIESENCIIDATIASQFETIREELRKETK